MPGTPIRITFRGQGEKNPFKNANKFRTPSRLRKHLEGRKD
jgi:GTP-binding protein